MDKSLNNYIKILKKYKKTYILKEELQSLFDVSSDKELFEIIDTLSKLQLLTPIKNSKTNGNRMYLIYSKYRITIPKETYETEIDEILKLHPLFQKNDYLRNNPQQYKDFRQQLLKLDRYLFTKKENSEPVSRKERSFEIFDEEKLLDNKTFCNLLAKVGLDENSLLYYDTPELSFYDYIPEIRPQLNLLICENKDIWFNFRRMMFENKARKIFDVHIDGVVFGCGDKIKSKGALTSYSKFMKVNVKFLYWGDIDREGLNIYLSAVEGNPELDIKLFVPAYEEMLRLAKGRNIPDSEDQRGIVKDYSSVFSCVSEELRPDFEKSIENNKRIPQEIISYAFLKNNMR